MGFWSTFFRQADRNAELKQSVWDRWLHLMDESRRAKSGQIVSWDKALQVSTVLCCARVIAEGMSQVPLYLFVESRDGRTREKALDHPLFEVMSLAPNPWQTSFEYRETTSIHNTLCGNGYSYMNMYRGRVAELIPFQPNCVTVRRSDTGFVQKYDVRVGGQTQSFLPDQILHTRGPSWDSYSGLDAVRLAREAIGLSMAAEETHAKFHQNGAKPSGVLSVPGSLTPDQHEQLRGYIAKSIGSANAGVPMIVDRAASWTAQSMTGVDAQHIETRLHQVRDICAFMRVMPLMVGYTDKASTYASAEQFFLAHLVHCLAPWYERFEQRFNRQLLTPDDRRGGHYFRFVEKGLLRAALKDFAAVLVSLTNAGVLTRNEAREELDYNALNQDGMDEARAPANVTGAAPANDPNAAPGDGGDAPSPQPSTEEPA